MYARKTLFLLPVITICVSGCLSTNNPQYEGGRYAQPAPEMMGNREYVRRKNSLDVQNDQLDVTRKSKHNAYLDIKEQNDAYKDTSGTALGVLGDLKSIGNLLK